MNTKLIMTASAVFMSLTGIILIFIPDELMVFLQLTQSISVSLLLQVLGTLYLSFGLLNWMNRGNVIGGIINRPISMSNFAHYMIVALTCIKICVRENSIPISFFVLTLVYSLFAIAFWRMAFQSKLVKS